LTTDSADRFAAYLKGVKSGSIVASKWVRLAVARHAADIRASRRKAFVFKFDAKRSAQVVAFIECLEHSTGEFDGRPFVLEPWQVFIIYSLFGWVHKKTGFRRFREAFVTIARGNGKSPLAAAILLVLFLFDQPREPRAEIKCCATEREQAYIVWSECKRFIEGNDTLKMLCDIYGGRGRATLNNTILDKRTHGTLVPLGKEAATKDGFNLHAYVIDEIHAFKEEHRELLEKLATAMGKRRQPLAVTITTAGSDRSTIWREQYDHAKAVTEGVYDDPAQFAFLAEIDPGDDPHDPANWPKANPNLGVSVKPDYLHRESEMARHNATKRHTFLRYHCNQLVSSLTKAISPEIWKRGTKPLPDLTGKPCHLGLDLGWRNDLASLAAMWPLGDNQYALKCWSFIPSEADRDLTRPPWSEWIANKSLRVTDGNTTDIEAIVSLILELRTAHDVRSLALDPNNARAIATRLVNEHGMEVFEFFQTCAKYNEPIQEFLSRLESGDIFHAGDGLLGWSANNLVLKTDSRDYSMPAKQKSREKIDPMVATFMAFSECLFGEAQGSIYEAQGLREF